MQPSGTPSTLAWYPQATAAALPPTMMETDPRLSCQHLEDVAGSIIASNNQSPVYRYSNTLAYKPVCRKRETRFIHLAGALTLPVISKVGIVDDVSSLWYQKGAVTEFGEPLEIRNISPEEKVAIARHMITLVGRLHEKGIIHGDVRLENFVKRLGDSESLRIVGFSAARLSDDSDLASWQPSTLSSEYTSPNRQPDSPSSLAEDDFALAVSIWALFAGEKPHICLLDSHGGGMPDLTKITDNELFCAVVDILAEGGLNVEHTSALSRRGSLSIERALSFPLSLFGADPEDLGEPTAVKLTPRICHECLDIALTEGEQTIKTPTKLQHPTGYQVAALNDYAFQWLHGQQITREAGALNPGHTSLPSTRRSSTRSLGRDSSLRIDTNASHLDVEGAVLSATSNATSGTTTATLKPPPPPADRSPGRDRSTTVVRAPLPAQPPSEVVSEQSKQNPFSGADSSSGTSSVFDHAAGMQRTMSHWSESSVEDDADDGWEDCVEDKIAGWMGATFPTPSGSCEPEKLRMSASFESVSLSDGGGEEAGTMPNASGL